MDSIQVFLLDEALADVDGTNVLTLAQRAVTACGCVVAAFLFNGGLISPTAARRLRTASVMYSCSVLASPLLVRLAGGLCGPALQVLRSSLVPFGVTSAFVVINLVLNQIYVFDDVQYVPIQLHNHHQQMMMPYWGGHERLWRIQKREHPQALLKKLVQSVQKKFLFSFAAAAGASRLQLQQRPQPLIVSPGPPLMDLAQKQVNYCMAAVFVMAASFLCWRNRVIHATMAAKQTASQTQQLPTMRKKLPTSVHKKPATPQSKRIVTPQKFPRSPMPSVSSPSFHVSSRTSAAIITSSVLALYIARQPAPDWLNPGDVEEY